MQRQLLLLIFIVFSTATFAQSISGVVKDEAGEPLPAATVEVVNSGIATTTNFSGFFKFNLSPGKFTLRIRYLGYEEQEQNIILKDQPVIIEIILKQKGIALNEITISANAKDPAYEIMQRVVENKDKYIQQPEQWKATTYIRASLEQKLKEGKTLKNDSVDPDGIIHFVESYGTTWFQQPDKIKEIKEAYKDRSKGNTESHSVGHYWDTRRRSGEAAATNPYLFYVSVSEADFNIYRSYINVPKLGPVPFVSPVSATATLSYKFHLIRSFYEDEKLINEIEIIPRNKEAALFKGIIHVVEHEWAIKKFDLTINDAALYHFKSFRVQREYRKVKDIYVLAKEEFNYTTTDGKFNLFGNTIVNYSDHEINPEVPSNFFKNELKVTLDDAYDKDSTYWDNIRLEPLKSKEAEFVHELDSLITYHRSEAYLKEQDSIYNRVKPLDFLLFGVGFHNSFKKRTLYFNPLVNSIQPFGVDGFRLALGGYIDKEFSRANELSFNGILDYGLSNSDIKGYGRLRYLYNPKKLARAYISYGDRFARITPNESIAGSLSRGNYVHKIYYGIGHEMEIANGLFLDVSTQYAKRKSIDTLELNGWWDELFGQEVKPQSFDPYNEWLLDIELSFTPGQKYYTEPYKKIIIGSVWPTFTLNYRKAIPKAFDATIDYDFIEFGARQDIRAGAFGTSRWQISSGVFLNKRKTQITDEKYFRGSDRYFFSNPLETFQLLGPTLSTTNEFLQINYLHNFESTLLNKVPLIKLLGLHTVVGAGALMVQDNNFRHAEVWAGIEKPFRIRKQMIKVGVYGVTSDNNSSKLDGSIKFGIDFFNAFTGKWSY